MADVDLQKVDIQFAGSIDQVTYTEAVFMPSVPADAFACWIKIAAGSLQVTVQKSVDGRNWSDQFTFDVTVLDTIVEQLTSGLTGYVRLKLDPQGGSTDIIDVTGLAHIRYQ